MCMHLPEKGRTDRQPNDKARSPALLALDVDSTLVKIDSRLDQIKADAGPDDARNIAAAVIAFEQPAEIGLGNADAAVGYRHRHFVPKHSRFDHDGAAIR